MLRPWTIAIETIGAIPRILADDLLVFTRGAQHCSKMQEAVNLTHQLLQDMGATIAPSKSFIFSNRADARKWFGQHIWKNLGSVIPVVKCVRDLGGTINTTARKNSHVIDARLRQAIIILRRFRFLPHTIEVKAKFIHTKVLPAALYGVECSEPSGHLLRQLQSCIADILGNQSARACNTMVYELASFNGIDLDPHVQQITRRVCLFRRMWARHTWIREDIGRIWKHYHDRGFMGTCTTDYISRAPAPPPGHPGRAQWKPDLPLMGPISLMLYSVSQIDSNLDQDFRILRPNHLPLDILNMPKQMVRPMVMDYAIASRMAWAASTRADLKDVVDIDREALMKAIQHRGPEDSRLRWYLSSLLSSGPLCWMAFISASRSISTTSLRSARVLAAHAILEAMA